MEDGIVLEVSAAEFMPQDRGRNRAADVVPALGGQEAIEDVQQGQVMAVYVDDVRHQFGRMVMCHLWADSIDELIAMVDKIGVQRKWLQKPPKASWVHFDISLAKKVLAIENGAVLTDKYGPVEFLAKLRGDSRKLETIAACRALPKVPA